MKNVHEQLDSLGIKMADGRLAEQRARYRDRELIMQAIQKQKEDYTVFTKQVVLTQVKDRSEDVQKEEALLQRIRVSNCGIKLAVELSMVVDL